MEIIAILAQILGVCLVVWGAGTYILAISQLFARAINNRSYSGDVTGNLLMIMAGVSILWLVN